MCYLVFSVILTNTVTLSILCALTLPREIQTVYTLLLVPSKCNNLLTLYDDGHAVLSNVPIPSVRLCSVCELVQTVIDSLLRMKGEYDAEQLIGF